MAAYEQPESGGSATQPAINHLSVAALRARHRAPLGSDARPL